MVLNPLSPPLAACTDSQIAQTQMCVDCQSHTLTIRSLLHMVALSVTNLRPCRRLSLTSGVSAHSSLSRPYVPEISSLLVSGQSCNLGHQPDPGTNSNILPSSLSSCLSREQSEVPSKLKVTSLQSLPQNFPMQLSPSLQGVAIS